MFNYIRSSGFKDLNIGIIELIDQKLKKREGMCIMIVVILVSVVIGWFWRIILMFNC